MAITEEKEDMVLEIIKSYFKEHGYSPSIRDICNLSGIHSTSSVARILKLLEKNKKIKLGGVARGIIAL